MIVPVKSLEKEPKQVSGGVLIDVPVDQVVVGKRMGTTDPMKVSELVQPISALPARFACGFARSTCPSSRCLPLPQSRTPPANQRPLRIRNTFLFNQEQELGN